MRASRFVETLCVIFGNGKQVPFWECSFVEDDYYGDSFNLNGERAYIVLDAIYDCLKKNFVSFFVIEHEEKDLLKVGQTVVCTKENSRALKTKIAGVIETEDQNIYEKVEDARSFILENYDIPKGTKVIVYKYKKYHYLLEGIEKPVHPLHVLLLEEN
jgi:hypothetical protein